MSEIQNFYHNSTVLITGGTGSLGKLLVEKLLRSCHGINHIYLLIRNKNGVSATERIEKYFEDPLFTRVKQENLHYLSKVTVIQGDIECDNLNLSAENKNVLINNVNIIIHAAANVNFNKNLRYLVDANLHGTRRMIELGKRMPNIKSIVHISTAYSNCHLSQIDEKIYPGPETYDEILNLLRIYNDEELEKITPMLRGKSPNNYTFAKGLAEQYIAENYGDLPIGIFRPAIVSFTANEPIEGWVDNFFGPAGAVTSAALGLLHVINGDTNLISNIVPGDLVVNAILASAWEIAEKRKRLPIYNYVIATENPVSWGQTTELIKQAFAFDLILKLQFRKPRFVNSYKRIHKLSDALSFFISTNIAFQNDNVTGLWGKLTPKDQELFYFNMKTLDWNEYFKHYIKGIRQFLLKDDFSNLPAARARYQKLYWLHQFSKILVFIAVFYSMYFIIKILF